MMLLYILLQQKNQFGHQMNLLTEILLKINLAFLFHFLSTATFGTKYGSNAS